MKDIPTQADDVTSLAATDFNQIPDELENAIESSGQTLDGADLFQIAKTSAIYSSMGDVYSVSGTPNSIILSAVNSRKEAPFSQFTIGTHVKFKAASYNTSTSMEVTPAGPGSTAVPVNMGYLSPGGTPSVPIDYFRPDYWYDLVYDYDSGGPLYYFRIEQVLAYDLENNSVREDNIVANSISTVKIQNSAVNNDKISGVSLSKLENGQADIQSSDLHMTFDAGELFLEEKTGGTTQKEFCQLTKDEIQFDSNDVGVDGAAGIVGPIPSSEDPYVYANGSDAWTRMYGGGIRYYFGPGNSDFKTRHIRKSEFAATVTWSTLSTGRYNTGDDITLTNIPNGTKIYRVSITFVDGGNDCCVNAFARFKDVTYRTIDSLFVTTPGVVPPSSIVVLVEYDASGL